MSNKILEGLYYSKSDEWVKVENEWLLSVSLFMLRTN